MFHIFLWYVVISLWIWLSKIVTTHPSHQVEIAILNDHLLLLYLFDKWFNKLVNESLLVMCTYIGWQSDGQLFKIPICFNTKIILRIYFCNYLKTWKIEIWSCSQLKACSKVFSWSKSNCWAGYWKVNTLGWMSNIVSTCLVFEISILETTSRINDTIQIEQYWQKGIYVQFALFYNN